MVLVVGTSKKITDGDICKDGKKIENAVHISNGKMKRVSLFYCPEDKEIIEIPQEE